MQCVTTPMVVLLNGSKLDNFLLSKGIHQDDPISPYLFVLCVERLSYLIHDALKNGRWKPIRVSRRGPDLSHSFLANDMMLFAEATKNQMQVILECLSCFCQASGQKVNFAKPSIYFSSNVDSSLA